MKLLFKSINILLVITVVFFWGERFGPRNAVADVYEIAQTEMLSLESLLALQKHPAGKRQIFLNGKEYQAELSYSQDSPQDVVNKVISEAKEQLASKEPLSTDFDDNIAVALSRPFSQIQGNRAYFIQLIKDITPGKGQAVFERISEGKGMGYDAEPGFLLMANSVNANKTAIWTIYFDHDFEFKSYLHADDNEAPGYDLPEIPRYPGSNRKMTFSDKSTIGESHIISYEGDGSVQDHIDHYIHSLALAGIDKHRIVKSDLGVSIFFFGKNKEINIFIHDNVNTNDSNKEILDLVQVMIL